jgi:hypothetical protein
MRARTTAVLLGLSMLAVVTGSIASAGGAKSNAAARHRLDGSLAELRVKLGHIAPLGTSGCSNCNAFQLSVDEASPRYRVPKGHWTIVKWRTRGGDAEEGSARLRVWRETKTQGKFRLIGQSGVKTVGVDEAAGFGAHVQVKRGDLLGIYAITGLAAGYETGDPDDVQGGASCFAGGVGDSAGVGTSCPVTKIPLDLANVAVTLKRR